MTGTKLGGGRRGPSYRIQPKDVPIIKKRIAIGDFLNRIAADYDVNPGRAQPRNVALVREQSVEFGAVLVQDRMLNNLTERDNLSRAWSIELQRPVALLGERQHRTYGRRDIVDWLGSIDPSRLPWRRMTTAA